MCTGRSVEVEVTAEVAAALAATAGVATGVRAVVAEAVERAVAEEGGVTVAAPLAALLAEADAAEDEEGGVTVAAPLAVGAAATVAEDAAEPAFGRVLGMARANTRPTVARPPAIATQRSREGFSVERAGVTVVGRTSIGVVGEEAKVGLLKEATVSADATSIELTAATAAPAGTTAGAGRRGRTAMVAAWGTASPSESATICSPAEPKRWVGEIAVARANQASKAAGS